MGIVEECGLRRPSACWLRMLEDGEGVGGEVDLEVRAEDGPKDGDVGQQFWRGEDLRGRVFKVEEGLTAPCLPFEVVMAVVHLRKVRWSRSLWRGQSGA